MMGSVSPDAALRTAVLEEFDWDALIDASQLDVGVSERVVTIVGTVGSVAEKLEALEAARSVAGVHDVVSRVDVKPPTSAERTDVELDAVVGQILRWDALVPEERVIHRVVDAWVTLSGRVPTPRQRLEAQRAVSHITGVRGVTNEIEVHGPELRPADVRKEIGRALERRAAHRAEGIDVAVDGDTVTLRGVVGSDAQKRAVLGAVGHAGGVRAVCDELTVDPTR